MASQSIGNVWKKIYLHFWRGMFQNVLFQFGMVLEFHTHA